MSCDHETLYVVDPDDVSKGARCGGCHESFDVNMMPKPPVEVRRNLSWWSEEPDGTRREAHVSGSNVRYQLILPNGSIGDQGWLIWPWPDVLTVEEAEAEALNFVGGDNYRIVSQDGRPLRETSPWDVRSD